MQSVAEHGWSLSAQAASEFARLGLMEMVDAVLARAAIVSHPDGNRRYYNLVLKVVGSMVQKVTDLDKEKSFIVYEECPLCEGRQTNRSGGPCPRCNGIGELRVVRAVR